MYQTQLVAYALIKSDSLVSSYLPFLLESNVIFALLLWLMAF